MAKHLPEWDDGERAKIAFDKIWDDLAELPLVEYDEVDRVVDGGHFTWNTISKPWRLSKTQEEVLFEISRGRTPIQIAKSRGITNRSVATHLKRCRIRLRVKTNEEAIAVAIGSGIISAIDRDPELGDRLNVRSITDRHKDVLKLLARGETNADIAQTLCISSETVKDHLEEICAIMGARNRTHAVSLAFTTGRLTLSGSVHSDPSSETKSLVLADSPTNGDRDMQSLGLAFHAPSGFGADDGFADAVQPIKGYLSSWKRRKYEFRHLNPKAARLRLDEIKMLREELGAAQADLEKRAVKATLSAPPERKK